MQMMSIVKTAKSQIHTTDIDGSIDSPTFIFLHYWGGSSRTWERVIQNINGAARCIAVDLRGWGHSSALDNRYDLQSMADDVCAVIDELNLQDYILVGHSMGGKVAQILALQRLNRLVAMVLIAPSPPQGMPVPEEVRQQMLASYQNEEGVIRVLNVLAYHKLSEQDQEQVIEDTLKGHPSAKSSWTSEGMLMNIGDDLSSIRVPVVISVGENDLVERPDVLKPIYQSLLPHAQFEIVPKIGHLLPLEASKEVAATCLRLLTMVKA